MENVIEWNVKVGKKELLQNLKKPGKVITLFAAFISFFYLIFELAVTSKNEYSISTSVTIFIVFLFLMLIVVYSYKTNKELFRDEIRNYKIYSSGVEINGNFYPWSNYKYFQDDTKLVESVSGMLPSAIIAQPTDRWIIQLLKGKFSDRNKLLLVMDDRDVYNKVRETVRKKLEESSSIT